MSKRRPFSIGDLVRITMLGSVHHGKIALVVDRVQYTRLNPHTHQQTFTAMDLMHMSLPSEDEYVPHPDEYSCRLQLISSDPDELDDRGRQVMVRAKWLEHVSSVEDTRNLTT
jgi:hypothetical protein